MKRGSFFSATKEKKPKKRKNFGISYKRGSFKGNQYVFNGLSESDDESEEEVFVLRQKEKTEKFVERVLQPGDTLLNIAVQYGYSVEELKRINNIHRDNEIFARTTLKVPIRIMETVAVHSAPKEDRLGSIPSMNNNVQDDVRFRTVSISDAYRACKLEGNDADAARRFLASMDQDLARIRESTSSQGHANYDLTVTNMGNALSGPLFNGAINKPEGSRSWVQILICSIILGFIAPIIYVLYLAEESTDKP